MTRNTPKRVKFNAIFMALLMVLSMVAIGTFAGTAFANHDDPDEEFVDGATYWQGQTLNLTNDNFDNDFAAGDEYQIRDQEDDQLIRERTAQQDGHTTVDTSGLDADQYNLTFVSGDASGEFVLFEVVIQTLEAEFDDDEVREDETTTLELESNRGSFQINITEDSLEADELEALFNDTGDVTVVDDDEDRITMSATGDAEIPVNVSLAGIDAGDYEFEIEVTDTDAEATASLTVRDVDVDIGFADAVISETEGDIVEIDILLTDTDRAVVFVGDEDSGFLVAAEIIDEEEEGEVTVLFNAYLAGQTDDVSSIFDAADDATIGDTWAASDIPGDAGDVETNVSEPLPAGDYELRLGTSADMTDGEVDNEEAVASLVLEERSTDALTISTAPQDDADADDDAEDLEAAMTETDEIAEGDRLIVKVEATGIFGFLDTFADEDAIIQELYNDTADPDEGTLTLVIEEEDAGLRDEGIMNLTHEDTEIAFVEDADNKAFYVVIDTRDVNITDDRDLENEWIATFTVGEAYPFIGEDEEEEVEQAFEVVEPETEFDNLDAEDRVQILLDEEATVSGTTNVAPGTEFEVRVRLSGEYLLSESEVEVQSDGTWSVVFDMTVAEVGQEPDVRARHTGSHTDEEATGIVVDEIIIPPDQDDIDALEQIIADLEAQIASTEGDLADAEAALADAQSQISDLESEVSALEGEVSDLEGQLADAESDLASAQSEVDRLEGELADAEAERDSLQQQLDEIEDPEQPGFGIAAVILALLAISLLAVRRHRRQG